METHAIEQQRIRDYLLGLMPGEEQPLFEEQLLTSDESYQELLIVEDELVDDYLGDRLSTSERESFESHFMTAPEHQQKLSFAHAFRKYVATEASSIEHEDRAVADDKPETRAVRTRSVPKLWGLLPMRNPFVGYAMAAAVLLILVGVSWFMWRNLNPSPRDPGRVVPAVLTPVLTRDERQSSNTISVPRDAGTVRLQLLLTDSRYASYEANLTDNESRLLRTQPNVQAETVNGARAAVVDIPAELLPAGDYRIKLSGVDESGNRDSLGTYSFRVQTP